MPTIVPLLGVCCAALVILAVVIAFGAWLSKRRDD